jgi:hypothetical protein
MSELLAGMMRGIAEQAGIPTMKEIAKQPIVSAAYRITVRYHNRRAADSVATIQRSGRDVVTLDVVYRGLFGHKPVAVSLGMDRYEAFVDGLQALKFDHLSDQPNIPAHGVDLWMVERAAGNFVKGVILAPELTSNVYARLVYLVSTTLPEAVREVRS